MKPVTFTTKKTKTQKLTKKTDQNKSRERIADGFSRDGSASKDAVIGRFYQKPSAL